MDSHRFHGEQWEELRVFSLRRWHINVPGRMGSVLAGEDEDGRETIHK
jgi:hypothetical protein